MTAKQWEKVKKSPEFRLERMRLYSRGYHAGKLRERRESFKSNKYPNNCEVKVEKTFLEKILSW